MAVTHQGPKGTRDFYPDTMAVRRHIEGVWRQASVDCGFDEVEGPTYEHLSLYTAKSGPGIVNELFSFRRAGGDDDYALRPEFTPTLARMVAAKAGSLPMPVKWFAIPVHFRAERQQRGRLREFVQWNVDLMGVEGAAADAEVIGCAVLAMERLGLKPTDVRVRLSHRGAVGAALAAAGVSTEKAGEAFELLDRRDKLEAAEFEKRAAAMGLTADARKRFETIAASKLPVSADAAALGALAEEVVADDESGHGLDHRDGAWEHAGIVTTATGEVGVFAGGGHGFLGGHDGGGRLEGDAEDDVFAVGNAALDTAGAVAGGADFSVDHAEGVVVLAACQKCAGEA
jgi:histidyl-tRNA synthetase